MSRKPRFWQGFTVVLLLWIPIILSPSQPVTAQSDLPVHGWTVCESLGIGPVPGIGARSRFTLCNGEGWVINTYCTQLDLPDPVLGAFCSRTNADTFWCGPNVQLVRLYEVVEEGTQDVVTRTPTHTPTATPTAPPTLTIPPAGTSTPRPSPGGGSIAGRLSNLMLASGGMLLLASIGLIARFRK